jgi:SAM-dependent methyltransferase
MDTNTALASCSTLLSQRTQAFNLFLVGFLVLFLELASIRWFAANVIFLHYFTNVVLLACFLGMSCGCLAARQRRDWLGYFPLLALGTACAAIVTSSIFTTWSGLGIEVGHQSSPQEIFFGTERRDVDVAQFTVPIDLIVGIFFVLIALMFVGLGQVLGKAFDAYSNRIMGYTLNIGGSLVGIVAFSLLSVLQAPPAVWFFIICTGIAYLLHQIGGLPIRRGVTLLALVLMVTAPAAVNRAFFGVETFWSPYYAVEYSASKLGIWVDNIGHQQMVPFDTGGSVYSLIHLLQRAVGGLPFPDELIIGAGSGNDIDHALHYGVGRVDAVEIDPVIQNIGISRNPDLPYADPRVTRHLDDGRHFMRSTERKYDLVVYALVDSLILHSGYANIRLESYLFTEQALADIKRILKPGGIFVTYNYFRQAWLVERLAAMAESVFGCKPVVLSLPYRETIGASVQGPAFGGFTIIIAGCNQQIAEAFAAHKNFWLNTHPASNTDVNGFTIRPETLPVEEQKDWQRIAPTTIIHDSGSPRFTTDDWPFLYVRDKLIPQLSIRSMIVLGTLGVAMVYLFLPKGRERLWIDWRMFFLGAGFMLLETKAVVQLALLFGSTWLVNSLVFFTALILILLANLYVLKIQPARLIWHYTGLLGLLAAAIAVPLDVFLGGNILWRYAVPCALALGPMFFAGVIFARLFSDSPNPDVAFGSNIAGSVVGGLSESFSMLLGFRYLLLLAVAFYLSSALIARRSKSWVR